MQPARRRYEGQRQRQRCSFCDYRQLLRYEKERCERHNHFFALCGVLVLGRSGDDIVGLVQSHLRASDYIFQVEPLPEPFQFSAKVGILLPETDKTGAQVVKERLQYLCRVREFMTQFGLAIYPDDGTAPEGLLDAAFRPERVIS